MAAPRRFLTLTISKQQHNTRRPATEAAPAIQGCAIATSGFASDMVATSMDEAADGPALAAASMVVPAMDPVVVLVADSDAVVPTLIEPASFPVSAPEAVGAAAGAAAGDAEGAGGAGVGGAEAGRLVTVAPLGYEFARPWSSKMEPSPTIERVSWFPPPAMPTSSPTAKPACETTRIRVSPAEWACVVAVDRCVVGVLAVVVLSAPGRPTMDLVEPVDVVAASVAEAEVKDVWDVAVDVHEDSVVDVALMLAVDVDVAVVVLVLAAAAEGIVLVLVTPMHRFLNRGSDHPSSPPRLKNT